MGFIGSELGSEVGGITGKFIVNKFFKDKNTGERIGKLVGKLEDCMYCLKMGDM